MESIFARAERRVMNELQIVRFEPDELAFRRWGHRHGLLAPGVDDGYAWHALMKATLGDDAPQPFVVRTRSGNSELLSYTTLDTRHWRPMGQEEDAIRALGLARLQVRPFPMDWEAGDRVSFEVRVRPVVRARTGRDKKRELDAAVHARLSDPEAVRENVYRNWLQEQLGRNGAAKLRGTPRLVRFRRSYVLRRDRSATTSKVRKVAGPDVVFRGELEIMDGDAFVALVVRGIGRHRAFGFGCLLLAPPGALR